MNAAELLRKAKARIADFENWSPSGGHNGKKVCALVALYDSVVDGVAFSEQNGEALETLYLACKQLYGHSSVVVINDLPKNSDPIERFTKVHAIYDRAIELAEKANGS